MLNLPAPDEVLAGKYRVERVIGRGGMGVVLAAWHLELDQRIALKFLLPELAERTEASERFRREARASAKIKSEHVARVLDVGNLEGNVPYMVMEYLDGQDLGAELREHGVLPIQECIDYVIQAIEAIAEAHALGIVHRDLKPENLFLNRRPDGTRCVKVLDFGISKNMLVGSADGRSLTRTANIIGSPFYMSPEQMRAPRTIDVRTDIWSIGAILYDLLGGRPPYVAETIPQLCTMMLESDPLPLRQLRPGVSAELEAVVARCLSRDVERRWSSVGELARALLPFASRGSRVHVERAWRVLATSAAGLSSGQNQKTLNSGHPGAHPLPPESLPMEAAPETSSAPPPMEVRTVHSGESRTQESWSGTQGSRRSRGGATSRPSKPSRWLPAVIGGGALMAALVAVWVVWGREPASGERSGSVLSIGLPDSAGRAHHPVPDPALIAAPPSTAVTAATPSGSAPSDPGAAPSAGAVAPSAEAVKVPPLPVKRGSTPSVPQRPRPASSGLTDFGGRR